MSRSLLSFLLLIAATLLMLFWQAIGFYVLHFFSAAYRLLIHGLRPVIYDPIFRRVIVAVMLPLLLGLIPAFGYWVFRRRWLNEYMTIVWCIWLVLMTMILIRQGSGA